MHKPVLLEEVIKGLDIKPDGLYIDGTFGRGGHSREILKNLGPNGRVLAFDKDPDAVNEAKRLQQQDKRFAIKQGSFVMLKDVLKQQGALQTVDGILLDLGVSSPQLDDSERGFSFMKHGPLDMRMDTTTGITAAEWLNTVDEKDLVHVLKFYGEERFAKRIANAVVNSRPIETTEQLSKIVSEAIPFKEKHKHPATRTFQAIRIFINRELDELTEMLSQILEVLAVGGRLAVISFHSLEDRIVKRFIQKEVRGDEFPADLPIKQNQLRPRLRKLGRATRPAPQEVAANPRARSAVLRVAERLA